MPAICGIDWANEWHDVPVADTDTGELLVEERFAHDEAGIRAWSGRCANGASHAQRSSAPKACSSGAFFAAKHVPAGDQELAGDRGLGRIRLAGAGLDV